MKTEAAVFFGVVAIFLAGCASPGEAPLGDSSVGREQIDQLPMYGGMDRKANPLLREADLKLISDTERHYGSREKASIAFADQGFRYYRRDDLANAMRRFNQAWLLDHENGDAYWGFGSVLNDKRRYCEAAEQFKTALSKPRIQPSAFADGGYVYAGCARTYGSGDTAKRDALVADSERAFSESLSKGVATDYVLDKWARARAVVGNYVGAWEKVMEYRRRIGKNFDQSFTARLAKEMPEPK